MLGPIFQRELLTVPRRGRHYLVRAIYLLVLWVLALTTWQAAFGWGRETTLGDIAYFGGLIFPLLCFLQLTLVLFFSALLAAGAITQEKDRRTFVLLLITDLRNHEIVLGKLLGSLLQIGALVLIALPVLALTILLGGVALYQVLLALLVLVSSALAAGALGCLLALWREKTFQTLALTFLFLVLYLLVVEGLGFVPGLADWQARLSPYRAMQSVIETEEAVSSLAVLLRTKVVHFSGLMLLFTVLLTGWGMWKLRIWNPSGEPIQQPDAAAEELLRAGPKPGTDIHAAPGRVRAVWANPILWREIRTRAYGHRPLLIKLAYLLVFGIICFWAYRNLPAAGVADRLLPAWGLVPVVVLSLLVLNMQAVTSITSERDGRTLELLFVSDLSPKEFIFGKLGGIFYNTKEIVLPPLFLAVGYGFWEYLAAVFLGKEHSPELIGLETLVYVLIALVLLFTFSAVLGLHVSLRNTNTRLAIGYSLGTIFFLFIGTLVCIYLILVSGQFEYQFTNFIFFLAVGIGGMWLVLVGNKPSLALNIAAGACPLAIFYVVTNIIVGDPFKPNKAGDVLIPFTVLVLAFGFTVVAMLVPLLSEFNVALSYTAPAEE